MAIDAVQLEPSNKRKRDVEDNGDREHKKAHVEDSSLTLDDLHLDVGEKYLLCKTRKKSFFILDLPRHGLVFQVAFQ